MTKVVISQPMYFPWYGHLEQIKHCDIYIFYDDVQFSRGFINRVQLKNNNGQKWITVPLEGGEKRRNINDIKISSAFNWKDKHLSIFRELYKNTKYFSMGFELMQDVLNKHTDNDNLSILLEKSTVALCNAFDIKNVKFLRSSELNVTGKSSKRLLDILLKINAKTYITGHGAKNYLDHKMFEHNKIEVKYIRYGLEQYAQKNNKFIPFVSSLDCLANCGNDAKKYIKGDLIDWQKFIKE